MRMPRWKLEKADWALLQMKAVFDTSVLVSLSLLRTPINMSQKLFYAQLTVLFHKHLKNYPIGLDHGGTGNVTLLGNVEITPRVFSGGTLL